MKKLCSLILAIGLSACGPDTASVTYGPPSNVTGPPMIAVGGTVYAPDDCGYGLYGHQAYKVLAIKDGMIEVEQAPYGRIYTAPSRCFTAVS